MTCDNLYISPDPIYARSRPETLVGREWLTTKLDHFMATHDRGVFVLEGVPGVGKTCYLSHLVKQRGYMHLFVEQVAGGDNLADGLRSIAAQIVQTWELQTWCTDDVVAGMPVRPDFLYRLLLMAAHHRDETHTHTPVVLVIDGLEQAGIFPGQHILGLPTTLPSGVYLIVSYRSGNANVSAFLSTMTSPVEYVQLSLDMPEQTRDIRAFLSQVPTHPHVAKFLHDAGLSDEQVRETLLDKSGGSWAYIRFVLDQIEQYDSRYLDLDSLPEHLCGCYTDYWQHQQAKEQWQVVMQPLFALLCVAQEPITVSTIVDVLKLDKRQQAIVEHLLSVRWKTFLLVSQQQGVPPRYTAGDASQSTLLPECSSSPVVDESVRALIKRMLAAVQQAHARIADYYLQGWGGLDYELPWLTSAQNHLTAQYSAHRYGLRHVIFHLIAAGQAERVHRLMQLEWITTEKQPDSPSEVLRWLYRKILGKTQKSPRHYLLLWYMVREQEGDLADFLGDVTQAWQLVDGYLNGQGDAASFELATKYALMYTSILSFSHEVPLNLLCALSEKDVWKPAQLLAYIRMLPDEMYRAQALKHIAPYIPKDMMQHMLAIARTIGEERERWKAIAGIAPFMPQAMLMDTLDIARAMHHPGWRVMAIIGLIPYIPEDQREAIVVEVLEVIKTVWHANFRVDALRGLAQYLPERLYQPALDMAKNIVDADWRAMALIGLAHYLPSALFQQAMKMWQVWSSFARAKVLAELGDRLQELDSMERLLAIVQRIENPHDRVSALAGVAPYLPGFLYDQAVDIALSFELERDQSAAIKTLAPYLPRHQLRKLQDTAYAMQDKPCGINALLRIMVALPAEEHDSLIDRMLDQVQQIGERKQRELVRVSMATQVAGMGEHYRDRMLAMFDVMEDYREQTRVLVNLAPYLPENMLYLALSRVQAIRNSHQRGQALAKLAPHLPAGLLPQALDIARAIGDWCEQAWVLVSLVYVMPPAMREQVFDVALHVGNDQHRAEVLVSLAESLHAISSDVGGELARVLDDVATIETGDHRAMALAGIAPFLPQTLHQRLFDAVRSTKRSHDRARALVGVVPHLPESLLRQVWDMVRELDQEDERVQVLVVLVPRLPAGLVRVVLSFARGIHTRRQRDALLEVLVPRVAREGMWQQALDAAWGIADSDKRALTLVRAAPHVPQMMLKQVMVAVRGMQQDEAKTQALAAMLDYLPTEDRPYVVQELLRAAHAAAWQGDAAPSKVLAYLPDNGSFKRILDSILMLVNPDDRVAALVDVMPKLPQPLRGQAIRQALLDTGKVWAKHRANALIQLVPHLPNRFIEQVIQDAKALEWQEWRVIAMTGMLPYVPHEWHSEMVQEPLEMARKLSDKAERVALFVQVLPYLAPSSYERICEEALVAAREIDDQEKRFAALSSLAPYLAELPLDVLVRLWRETLPRLVLRTRKDVLADIRAMQPVVARVWGDDGLVAVARAVLDVGRWFT